MKTEIERYQEMYHSVSRQMRGNWMNPRSKKGKRFNGVFFFISFLLLVAFQIETSLFIYIMPSLVLFLGIVSLGIFLVCMRAVFPLLDGLKVYFGLLGLACFTSFVVAGQVVRFQASVAQERSTELIEGLDQYFQEHQKYPLTLHDLVPEYVSGIPITGMGIIPHQFRYENFAPLPVYRLSFAFHGGDYDYYYLSIYKNWATRYPESSW